MVPRRQQKSHSRVVNLLQGEVDESRPHPKVPRNVLRKPLALPPMRPIKDERKAA